MMSTTPSASVPTGSNPQDDHDAEQAFIDAVLARHNEAPAPVPSPASLPRRQFLKWMGAAGLALGLTGQTDLLALARRPVKAPPNQVVAPVSATLPADLTAQPILQQLGEVEGLSANQLAHHVKLYEGYVKAYNTLNKEMRRLLDTPPDAAPSATWHPLREVHLEHSYAFNGILLHEWYFGNLAPAQKIREAGRTRPSDTLAHELRKKYGSVENYLKLLNTLGKSSRGWVVTGYSHRTRQLDTFVLDLHNQGSPVGLTPLLVLDVYEHAYFVDYQTNRAAYLDVFANNLRWDVVSERLEAVHSLRA